MFKVAFKRKVKRGDEAAALRREVLVYVAPRSATVREVCATLEPMWYEGDIMKVITELVNDGALALDCGGAEVRRVT